jgi:hypothetical protein
MVLNDVDPDQAVRRYCDTPTKTDERSEYIQDEEVKDVKDLTDNNL